MEFDDEIRVKIKSNLPKLSLFDITEYEKLLSNFQENERKGAIFLQQLDVTLSWQDAEEFITHGIMTPLMLVFFANYLQNENLLKGEEASIKLYFGLVEIKVFDANGNLEYDPISEIQKYITLPNYVDEIFNSMVIFVYDLQRWYALYLDKTKKLGQLFDFKHDPKVDVYQNLEVLNELVKEEYKFQIVDYDIRVLTDNVNMNTDGSYFLINLLYKLIQGIPLEKLTFNPKEKQILKQRLEWILLKTREIFLASQMKKTKHSNGGRVGGGGGDGKSSRTKTVVMNESGGTHGRYDSESDGDNGEKDDIILDTSVHTRNMQSMSRINQSQNTYNQGSNQNRSNSISITYPDGEKSNVNNSVSRLPSLRNINQERKKTTMVRPGRNATKLLSMAPRQPINNNNNTSSQISFNRYDNDLQESFDMRNNDSQAYYAQQQQQQSQSQMQPARSAKSNRNVSYQESAGDDLDSMWNFGKETGPQKVYKRPDDVSAHLGKMWDFKSQFKNGQRTRNNVPVLIPEDQKELYRERADQQSLQRDLSDKIVDILTCLDDPTSKELFNNPSLRYAVSRLKEKLGVSNDEDGLNNASDKIKSTDMKELKSLLKQRLMQGVTGGLDAILERQKILDDILEYDTEERGDLEKRFEGEIQKIDQRFQQYMQKYDSLNQFQNLQHMYGNAYWGPPAEEINGMKESMHAELQNYLLSGLGLPGKFSSNPLFLNGKVTNMQKDKVRDQRPAPPGFNQSAVFQKDIGQAGMQGQQGRSASLNNSASDFRLKNIPNPSKYSRNTQDNNDGGRNIKPIKKNTQDNQMPSVIPPDAVAMRYKVTILQKDVIDVLTVDRVSEKVVRFLLGYLEERYFNVITRDVAMRDEHRILIYPCEFYTSLSYNNPGVPQQSLNYDATIRYTNKFTGTHTIFHEFDKLVMPIYFENQNYTLCVVDLNVQQILVFNVLKKGTATSSAVAGAFPRDATKNPVGLNILRYVEKEYADKLMKKLPILNWSIQYVPCVQTSSEELTVYYMLLYLAMTLDQRFKYKYVTEEQLKNVKLWIPDVFKSVGITTNQPGEIQVFVDPP